MVAARPRFPLRDIASLMVILGALSAFALPGFANVERESRRAALASLSDAMDKAAAVTHAVWLAGGARGDSVLIEGRAVKVNALGFPAGSAGIRAALPQDPVGNGYVLLAEGFAPAGMELAHVCTLRYDSSVSPPAIALRAHPDCE